MKERTLTGLAIFFVVAVVLLTKIIIGTTIILDIFWGLLVVTCAYEMANILKHQQRPNHVLLIVLFPIFLFALLYTEMALKLDAILSGFLVLGLIMLFVLIGFFVTLFSTARTENEMRVNKIRTSKSAFAFSKSMNNLIGFLYPTVPLMMMFPINHLAEISYLFEGTIPYVSTISIVLVALCFLVPFICDTFAYFVGKTFGGPRFCPKISPKKTISGFIGGVLATISILLVLYFILSSIPSLQSAISAIGLEWWGVALIGLLGSLACTGGDLFESFMKRKAELKDSGNILPGHGGFLDRLDGFVFVVPVIMIVALIIVL